MRIAVVGAGSVGGVVAHALARVGAAPTILARHAAAQALRAGGLTLETREGAETRRIAVETDPAVLGPQDVVIAGFKAQDWPAALPGVLPLVGPETLVVPMLNGIPWWYLGGAAGAHAGRRLTAVDPDGTLSEAFPAERLAGCVVYMGATRTAPGRVLLTTSVRLVLGAVTGAPHPALAPLAALFEAAGFAAPIVEDVRAAVWTKLLGNASFNPMSVLTGAPMDVLLSDPGMRRLATLVMREIAAIAAAAGAPVTANIEERLDMNAKMVGFKTSMLQDYEAGRPLELGAILDAPLEIADLLGVPAHATEALRHLAARRAAERDGALS